MSKNLSKLAIYTRPEPRGGSLGGLSPTPAVLDFSLSLSPGFSPTFRDDVRFSVLWGCT